MIVVDAGVHGLQSDGGHAQRFDAIKHLGDDQAAIGSTQMPGNGGVMPGIATHMQFVDHRLIGRHQRLAILRPEGPAGLAIPIAIGVDDDSLGHERRTVALTERHIVSSLLR